MYSLKRNLKIGVPLIGGALALKKFGTGNLHKLFETRARADTDILLDENVLPEFSIELDEAPPHIK